MTDASTSPSDERALRRLLQERLRVDLADRDVRVAEFAPVAHGHSGFTFALRLRSGPAEEDLVLRVAPPGTRPHGPADLERQARIMRALHRAGLPVPAVRWSTPGLEPDGSRPAVLTERIIADRIETVLGTTDAAEIASGAIDAAAAIHAIPVGDTGIADEVAVSQLDEIERWRRLMERAVAELTVDAPRLERALRSQPPAPREPTLVHGDFHYGNLLFDGGRVRAILDWEIAQIGQPLLDVAGLAVMSQGVIFGAGPNPGGTVDISAAELARLYGCPEDELAWYLALSAYKYAAILGYNLMLHRNGRRPDDLYPSLARPIERLVAYGLRVVG